MNYLFIMTPVMFISTLYVVNISIKFINKILLPFS